MQIKDIMSKDVEVVAPNAPVHEVAGKMQSRDCGCVVVVQDDKLVGMVTDRDIALRCVATAQDNKSTTADKVMSDKILYCFETDDSDTVAKNMATNKVRRLPVLNAEKRLVGIVSLGDIASNSNPELCGKALGDICNAA